MNSLAGLGFGLSSLPIRNVYCLIAPFRHSSCPKGPSWTTASVPGKEKVSEVTRLAILSYIRSLRYPCVTSGLTPQEPGLRMERGFKKMRLLLEGLA